MFKRNPGRFTHKIELLKPSEPARDELGGIAPTTYSTALTINAMCEQRSQARQDVLGDYVTTDTRFFVVRDLTNTAAADIDTTWRLKCDGRVYLINQVLLIDESVPYFVQITATATNSGGGLQ